MFLASVLEQLDLAREQIIKGDVHSSRFGLMLTDNAVELVLHQIVKDKAGELRNFNHIRESYPHRKELAKALGKAFEDKLKFARVEDRIEPATAKSIGILHNYRNEVYHVRLQHKSVLPTLTRFSFHIACMFISTYNPRGLGWGSSQVLPERAKKYFNSDGLIPGNLIDFQNGCQKLAETSGYDADETISVLAMHMSQVLDEQDILIDVVANGVYEGQQTTRKKAVIATQAWKYAFTDKADAIRAELKWNGSVLDWVNWLEENHPFKYQRDPIPSWLKQLKNLQTKKSPHAALEHYHSFMIESADLRDAIEESAGAAEAEIDAAVDRMRGK